MMKKLFLCALVALSMNVALATAGGVASGTKACIEGAMRNGSNAIGNKALLNVQYVRYFNEDAIAKISAGNRWNSFSNLQKDNQRKRVRRVVLGTLVPQLAKFKNSPLKLLSEETSKFGRKVYGQVGAKKKARVTWYMPPLGCRFDNVAVAGYGSLAGWAKDNSLRQRDK